MDRTIARTAPATLTLLTLGLAALAASGCAEGRSRLRAMDPTHTSYAPSSAADAGMGRGDGGAALADAAMPFAAPDAAVLADAPAPVTILPGVPALRCGRTYEQETSYLVRGGAPDFATMRHRDGTSLPADEGGASCGGGSGCSEEVTLLCDGDSPTGVLHHATTFRLQGPLTAEPGTGPHAGPLCGEELPAMPYAAPGTTLPGFVNGPQPAAPVPTLERCEVSVRAVGGCVWVRAVTVACETPNPNQP